MSISQNENRIGYFTSSGIFVLLTTGKQENGFGVGAITYIYETNIERLLGRSITTEIDAKPTSWGNLIEPLVHNDLGLQYTYQSDVTVVHPTIKYWSGSADGFNNAGERAVTDIKSPFTLKSFVGLVLPLYMGKTGNDAMTAIREGFKDKNGKEWSKHPKGETYYWQLVSNAIINNCNFAELIVFMPYQSQLLDIKNMAIDNPAVKWLQYLEEDQIPFIPDNGMFKNLNIIRFEVPQSDKDLLTATVLKAGSMLIDRPGEPSVLIAPPTEVEETANFSNYAESFYQNNKPIL